MIRFARKWLAFVLAWLGWLLQHAGDGLLIIARTLHPDWE